jgi:hypothetical protein
LKLVEQARTAGRWDHRRVTFERRLLMIDAMLIAVFIITALTLIGMVVHLLR